MVNARDAFGHQLCFSRECITTCWVNSVQYMFEPASATSLRFFENTDSVFSKYRSDRTNMAALMMPTS
jgi:hypothetical protein